jgi:hypothetical protein
MKSRRRLFLNLVVLVGLVVYAGICFHSVQEIHYLKSFFPRQFTVQEAYYAAGVELIKIVIIGIPIVLVIAACLVMLIASKRDGGAGD